MVLGASTDHHVDVWWSKRGASILDGWTTQNHTLNSPMNCALKVISEVDLLIKRGQGWKFMKWQRSHVPLYLGMLCYKIVYIHIYIYISLWLHTWVQQTAISTCLLFHGVVWESFFPCKMGMIPNHLESRFDICWSKSLIFLTPPKSCHGLPWIF